MNVLESKNFQMLQEEERERVLLLKTRFDKLFELEKLAFLELCGLVSTTTADKSNKENRGKLSHYTSPRLTTVQARDAGFVVLQQSVEIPSNKTPANAGDYTNASSDASLRKLIQPSLFGQGRVGIRKERKSLYEKIGMEGEDEEEEEEEEGGKGANAPPPIGVPGEYKYRSNAYQAMRLAHSFPQHINVHPNVRDDQQTANMINATGMPVYENELRGFFEELDSNHSGQLDLEDFQQFMRSLDRSLGVDDEYARLEKEGSRLAADGKLGFEAFAYLVLRFARA